MSNSAARTVWNRIDTIQLLRGRLNRRHRIECDGYRLFITSNLCDALRQCRQSDSRRVLWADSVCINQDDDEEKSQQVSVMSEIYSQAKRVLICLGPDQTGGCAKQAQSFLRDFNDMFERTLKNISGDWNSFPLTDDGDPLLNDTRWSSWASLSAQPWFKRGWVVQEAGLAKDALILWGRARINWLWIQRIIAWGVRCLRHQPPLPKSSDIHLDIYKVRYKEEAISMWKKIDFFVDEVLGSLNDGRQLDVTDDRDRIYAFLGLPVATDIRANLSINYEQTWEAVFHDFACCYLDSTQDLNILHFIQPSEATIDRGELHDPFLDSTVAA